MNFGNSIKKIAANINVSWKFYKMTGGCKPNCAGGILDTLRNKNESILKEQLNSLSLLQKEKENVFFSFPKTDLVIRQNIVEPDQDKKIKVELPLSISKDKTLELPFHIEKEVTEPSGRVVVIKKAAHLLVIRRKKMKKHKKKKFQRKYKIQIEALQEKQKLAQEKKLNADVQSILKMTDFSAEKYVKDKLDDYNWVEPVTRVRGRLAPDWVIKKHLEDEAEKKVFRERINECINYRK